jgi:uncharacterized membrane protein
MAFREWVDLAGLVMEGAGVAVMVFGAVISLVVLVVRRGHVREGAYRRFRQDMGRAILLGLELLVAADIIRTVSEAPTLNGVLVLGLIVVIRTFLSVTLSVELEGRWPWQRGPEHVAPEHRAAPSPPLHGSPPPADADGERPAHH